MLIRRLVKGRSRHIVVLGWMHTDDGVEPQRCDSLEQFEREVAAKLGAGYEETPRSLSRRVLHEGGGQPNEKFWAIELEGSTQLVHYGRLRNGAWLVWEGTRRDKDFPSEAAALADCHAKIGKKLRGGMREYCPRDTDFSSPAKAKAAAEAVKAQAVAQRRASPKKSKAPTLKDDPKLHIGATWLRSEHATLPDLAPLAKGGYEELLLDRKLKRAPHLPRFLDACKTLRRLTLHDPAVLAPPPKKSKVRELAISGSSLDSLAFVSGFAGLEVLELAFRGVRKLTSFDELVVAKKLRRLRANQHSASTLAPLGELPRLEEYAASSTKHLRSLDGLQGCPKLRHVNANLAPIADLTPLAEAKKLEGLKLRKAKLLSLEPIYGAKKLETLFAEKSDLRTIEGIADGLPTLALLWLHSTRVRDIRPLRGLARLLELDLAGLPIEDFSPLAELPKLEYLDLFETAFDDLDLLDGMPNLVRVRLAKTKVKKSDPRVKKLDRRIKANNPGAEGLVFSTGRGGLPSLGNDRAAYVGEWGQREG